MPNPSAADASGKAVSSGTACTEAATGGALRSEEVPHSSSARAPPHLLGAPLAPFFVLLPFFRPLPLVLEGAGASGHTLKDGGTEGFPLPPSVDERDFLFDGGAGVLEVPRVADDRPVNDIPSGIGR